MRVARLARGRSESSRKSPLRGIRGKPLEIINISSEALCFARTVGKPEKCPEMVHYFEKRRPAGGSSLTSPRGGLSIYVEGALEFIRPKKRRIH